MQEKSAIEKYNSPCPKEDLVNMNSPHSKHNGKKKTPPVLITWYVEELEIGHDFWILGFDSVKGKMHNTSAKWRSIILLGKISGFETRSFTSVLK